MALVSTPALASVDPISDFFDEAFGQPTPEYQYVSRKHSRQLRHYDSTNGVSQMIAEHVSARIGSGWVSTALQIAHIESGGRCGAVNRSGATGVFQVMHPERFGVSRSSARTCAGGIAAGVSHMQACIAKGAHTHSQMLRCHNSGSPFGRVERAYRRYI